MGYTTDFIGQIDISPSLNKAEQLYLTAFAQSRRWGRIGGPYEVPGNPAAEADERVAQIDAYNATAAGQPSLWCGWQPCWDGCCVSYDGREKFYGATSWMQYLIDHFLAPEAHAATSGLDWFEEFTFDHVLDGTIAACRRDTRELYLIIVEHNVVSEKIIRSADSHLDLGPLPYEEEIDKSASRRRRRA